MSDTLRARDYLKDNPPPNLTLQDCRSALIRAGINLHDSDIEFLVSHLKLMARKAIITSHYSL